MKSIVIYFLAAFFLLQSYAQANFGRQYIQCSRKPGNESLVINLQKHNHNLTYHSGSKESKILKSPLTQKMYLISSTGRYITFSNNQSPIQETVKIPTPNYGRNQRGFEVIYERFNIVNDIISEVNFLCFSKLLGEL
ncbi:hypothetical protein N9N67_04530 [Bacteriovoracaceae bacterium]|nr:hypothetical protein [Bacteriovoracaceae bacterium]